MAPLPHNNTALYYVDYATGPVGHTVEVRANGLASPSTFAAFFDALMEDVADLTCAITINAVRFQAEGTNISSPVVTGLEGNVYGAGAGTSDQYASSLNFVGRSPGGRRVKLSIFGYDNAFGSFRLATGASAPVLAVVNNLNTASNLALAIDGDEAVWYPYANISVNAYWQRQLRA